MTDTTPVMAVKTPLGVLVQSRKTDTDSGSVEGGKE